MAIAKCTSVTRFVLITLCVILPWAASAHQGLHHEIERLSELIDRQPQRMALFIQRAIYYRLEGHLQASLNDLDRARALAPEHRGVMLQRGLTLSAMARYEGAIAEFDRFMQTGKPTAAAYAERGRIHARLRHAELAINDLTHALHLRPTISLYHQRGQLQEALGLLDDAAMGYREGLARLGQAMVLKQALIRVEMARQHHDVALRLIDEELARASVKTPWHLRRAEVLAASAQPVRAQREVKRALADVNRILRKRPTSLHLVWRAKVYMAMAQWDRARHDLSLAIRQHPHYREAKALLVQLETKRQSP